MDYDGYEPEEMRSLARWMLRSDEFVATFVPDEKDQFYWMDRLKSNMTKKPHLFLKSIVEDHATAPNSLIERVLDFIETGKWQRDPYVAVHLMTDIAHLPVDRSLSRAYDLAVRDVALDTLEHKVDWEEGTKEDSEKQMEVQEEFLQTCELSNQPIPEEKARELVKLALRVQQLSPKDEKGSLDLLWSDLFRYVDGIDADDDLKKRMLLIARAYNRPIRKWRKKELMMLLWAVYSLMEVATLPEPHTTKLKDMIDKTLKSRDTKTRLCIPIFAVDVTTKRGRCGSDTTKRLLKNKTLSEQVGSENELRKKYNPIDASHGPSPHDTLQTMADFKTMVTECERLQSSSLVPKLFEMPQDEEGTMKRGDDEEEQVVKRLKSDAWRVAMQVAESDVVDETLIDTLPRTTSRSVMLDFEKGVSYEGPLHPTVALGALLVSRLGTKLANLKSVPKVRLLLNAAKSKIYLEKALFGDRPKETDTDLEAEVEERGQVTLLQRSLHRATNTDMMNSWWTTRSQDMIKMFIFRRLVGISCSPMKCLVHGPTGNIQMADLYSSPKDYKRCQTTVRKESADWLFDSSSHRKIITLVSSALTEDKDCIAGVISWLSTILDRQAFNTATASILEPYAIPFEDFKENVQAVMSAYGVVPETDDEDED